jgi:uncharacterized protein (TIGR01244 family)
LIGMASFRQVSDDFAVAGQITASDLQRVAAAGFRQVINNRPDGEEPGQPTAAELGLAAGKAGLAYRHIPISGMPAADQLLGMTEAVKSGPTLAFCRSGARSIAAWALSEALSGKRTRSEIVTLCANAGFDASVLLGD